jgi:hypothetical protein
MESLVSSAVGDFILRLPSSSTSSLTTGYVKRITVNVEILREKGISAGEVLIVRSPSQAQDGQWKRVRINPVTTS